MTLPNIRNPMPDQEQDITDTVLRERSKLGNFIRHRVGDQIEADDILQDVFEEFIEAYRLPEPIEQVSAWLFRVARNRIIDRFRKKKEQLISEIDDPDRIDGDGDGDGNYMLDLMLPALDAGPEAAYSRSVLLKELQHALDELPENQRDVFIAHELEGMSFKELASESGIAVNTLLARKRYAVLYLRNRLQTIYDEFDVR
ncbi:MAG: RNA polymerase sigma factor [Burkholderiales bacterium]